jgi:hypothetical protein
VRREFGIDSEQQIIDVFALFRLRLKSSAAHAAKGNNRLAVLQFGEF